ncbi:MAG: DcaP family trimeric outer membrane transporter [Terracidiphilus sp.]
MSNSEKASALQKQLDDLKAQMQQIQAQILELSKAEKPAAAKPAPPAPSTSSASAAAAGAPSKQAEDSGAAQAAALHIEPKRQVEEATAKYQTDSQDQLAAPRIDNAPLDPRYPGYFRLPGTQTLLRIGGYFKTDFIYDLKPAGESEKFVPSSFPIPAPVGVNNTTVSIRPTRMNLDFLIPVSSSSVRFFMEYDFFGTNSTTPRLRHAYAQVANFLVGQSFSNFMDPDAGPDTLEFQGPNSQILIRNPQLRYSVSLGEKTSLSFSLEKASSDVAFATPTFNSLPNSPTPDGAIKFRHGFTKGHVQFATLMRSPAAYLPDGRSDSVFGWGLNLTGALNVTGKDMLVYQGAYGAGMERYVNDTSGLGIDAAPKDAAHLKAVPLVATYGGYQHYWADRVRSSAVYGFAQAQNTSLQPGSAYHQSNYSAANIIWNPLGSLNIGTEFLYGWLVERNKESANAPRFMFSAKYNFIKQGETKK